MGFSSQKAICLLRDADMTEFSFAENAVTVRGNPVVQPIAQAKRQDNHAVKCRPGENELSSD